MFDELTVAENIFMGHMPTAQRASSTGREMRSASAELLKRIDAPIPPEFKLKRLSVAQKHLVEIARALSPRGAGRHHGRADRGPVGATRSTTCSASSRSSRPRAAPSSSSATNSTRFSASPTDFVCLRDGEKVGEGPISVGHRGASWCA